MLTVFTLTKEGTVPRFSEITNQLLDRLPSTVQLHTETINAEKLLGSARDQFDIDADIVRGERNGTGGAQAALSHLLHQFGPDDETVMGPNYWCITLAEYTQLLVLPAIV